MAATTDSPFKYPWLQMCTYCCTLWTTCDTSLSLIPGLISSAISNALHNSSISPWLPSPAALLDFNYITEIKGHRNNVRQPEIFPSELWLCQLIKLHWDSTDTMTVMGGSHIFGVKMLQILYIILKSMYFYLKKKGGKTYNNPEPQDLGFSLNFNKFFDTCFSN